MNPARVAAALRALADAIEAPAEGEPANTVEPVRPPVTKTTPQEAHALAADRLRRAGVRPRVPSPHGQK